MHFFDWAENLSALDWWSETHTNMLQNLKTLTDYHKADKILLY